MSGSKIFSWEPSFANSYWGPCGGPELHGPSNAMKELCRLTSDVSVIFFKLLPMQLIVYISKMLNEYAHEDWVAPVEVVDRDGNIGKNEMETV